MALTSVVLLAATAYLLYRLARRSRGALGGWRGRVTVEHMSGWRYEVDAADCREGLVCEGCGAENAIPMLDCWRCGMPLGRAADEESPAPESETVVRFRPGGVFGILGRMWVRARRGPEGISWTCRGSSGETTFTTWSEAPPTVRAALDTLPKPIREQVEAVLKRGRLSPPSARPTPKPMPEPAPKVAAEPRPAPDEGTNRWLEIE